MTDPLHGDGDVLLLRTVCLREKSRSSFTTIQNEQTLERERETLESVQSEEHRSVEVGTSTLHGCHCDTVTSAVLTLHSVVVYRADIGCLPAELRNGLTLYSAHQVWIVVVNFGFDDGGVYVTSTGRIAASTNAASAFLSSCL